MKICFCGNCNTLYEDMNPQTDAPDIEVSMSLDPLILCKPADDPDEDHEVWCCPDCETDSYLQDANITLDTQAVQIGSVYVDSGQLVVCDPAYIDEHYKANVSTECDHNHPVYRHKETGQLWQYTYAGKSTVEGCKPFPGRYSDVIPEYGKAPNDLIEEGVFEQDTIDPTPHIPLGEFSYRGICKATSLTQQAGSLNFNHGHAGAGVAFKTGIGDGEYPVTAHYVEVEGFGKRIARITIDFLK